MGYVGDFTNMGVKLDVQIWFNCFTVIVIFFKHHV
jgi:hypothetical protein